MLIYSFHVAVCIIMKTEVNEDYTKSGEGLVLKATESDSVTYTVSNAVSSLSSMETTTTHTATTQAGAA